MDKKKPITFDTPEERVARIIAANGQAPNLVRQFDKEELAELAAMIEPDGTLLPGKVMEGDAEVEVSPQEAFRLFMVRHYDKKKAVVAEDDRPAVAEAVTDK